MTPNPKSSPAAVTRRAMLQQAGLGMLGFSAFAPALSGAEATAKAKASTAKAPAPSAPPGELAPLNRFGRMMQEYYVARVREVERAGNARRAALRTRADAEAYVRDVRQKAQRC